MTAPRPFAEVVAELTRLRDEWSRFYDLEDATEFEVACYENLPALLSRLASREAVFEAAVALTDAIDGKVCGVAVSLFDLRAAIAQAQADEEQPRAEPTD